MPSKSDQGGDSASRQDSSKTPNSTGETAKLKNDARERSRAFFQQRQLLASGSSAIPLTWPNRPPGMPLPQIPALVQQGNGNPAPNPFQPALPGQAVPFGAAGLAGNGGLAPPGPTSGLASPAGPGPRFPAAVQSRTQTQMSPAAAARAHPAAARPSGLRTPLATRANSGISPPVPVTSKSASNIRRPSGGVPTKPSVSRSVTAPASAAGQNSSSNAASAPTSSPSSSGSASRPTPSTPGSRPTVSTSASRTNGGPVISSPATPKTSSSASSTRSNLNTPNSTSTPSLPENKDGLVPATGAAPGARPPPRPISGVASAPGFARKKRPNMTLSDLQNSPAPATTARPQLNGLGTAASLVTDAMAGKPTSAPSAPGSDSPSNGAGKRVASAPPGPVASPPGGGRGTGGMDPALTANTLDEFANIVDPLRGTLRFGDRAVLDATGVRFAGGHTFRISLDDVELLQELGRGNYGTVFKVIRCRRKSPRKPNTGLAGTRQRPLVRDPSDLAAIGGPSGYLQMLTDISDRSRLMAMKEVRLQLDTSRLGSTITELEILNRCMSPQIVDFFGAFFQESAVYICMEYMDGGSVDRLYEATGMPEPVLAKIALATIQGLRYLKNEQNVIHRDVKPTNILTNTRGQVKICDFGVSGNLVGSLAKTNVGCQSYMAPERIAGPRAAALTGSQSTYNSRSDIWSLGLTIVECALGRYPYPTDMYGQLESIVSDSAPKLPAHFSAAARDFTSSCLRKNPMDRPSYDVLIKHPWLVEAEKLLGPTATFDPEADPSVLANRVAEAAISAAKQRARSKSGSVPNNVASLPPELIAAADAILDKEDERYPVVDRDVANWVRRGIRRRRARLREKGIVVEE